jgi:AcrR family transcriptional regulator
MSVQERRAKEKQELRQEIIDAARDLFINEGFENVSMRKIADRIDYSPTTIYLYFQDKIDLLDCICEETLSRLQERLAGIRDEYSDPVERMHRGLRAYIDFGLEHPGDYRVAFILEFKQYIESGRCLRCHTLGQQTFDGLRNDVAECVRSGAFASGDIEAMSQVIWAAIHGLASLLITRSHFPWVDRDLLIETLVDSLIRGFRRPASEPAAIT